MWECVVLESLPRGDVFCDIKHLSCDREELITFRKSELPPDWPTLAEGDWFYWDQDGDDGLHGLKADMRAKYA